jgi:hypothetical protein
MKPFTAFLLAIIVALTAAFPAAAQSPETIWLAAPVLNYKTGETILVTVNAVSSSPIQGFTFQIRYDPACLQPTQATSPIPGMNGLQLPQLTGLVDASFASATPQTVNGVLAEVRFVALKGCQTSLTLESAALAIRNEAGFAAPLPGVSLGEKTAALNVSKERGAAATPPLSGTPLILGEAPKSSTLPLWIVILLSLIFGSGLLVWTFTLLRKKPAAKKPAAPSEAAVQFKRGPRAGETVSLRKLPCNIGSDPINEICLDDPSVSKRHAKIFADNGVYYLLGLSGETFLNGAAVSKSAAALKPGDMVRLGQNVFFTFAA